MNLVKRMSGIENSIDEIKSILKQQDRASQKKEILTAQEAMDLLKINRSTFSKWKSIGYIQTYKISSRIYVKYSQIMEALENGIIEQKNQ